ncbi:MAG: hypothetical protein CVV07_01060 [Gammaproteobacteria bacterium HGW-Gammaproteobacteria-11]|nr:MAG: hypothetical protein CVV07_01060 [Gammaproteobacteria bacterium HGW-Gammaproteobacteria-11]
MSDKKQNLYPVTLLKDHEHAGKKELAGKTIHVNALAKQWLVANKIIGAEQAPEPAVTAVAAATQPAKKG